MGVTMQFWSSNAFESAPGSRFFAQNLWISNSEEMRLKD
jgi:hypothetical protein